MYGDHSLCLQGLDVWGPFIVFTGVRCMGDHSLCLQGLDVWGPFIMFTGGRCMVSSKGSLSVLSSHQVATTNNIIS